MSISSDVSPAAVWSVLAGDQGRAFAVSMPETCEVRATAKDATTVVDTLLENVFAHTAPPAPIRVTVSSDRALTVEDGGSGFDESAIDRGASGSLRSDSACDLGSVIVNVVPTPWVDSTEIEPSNSRTISRTIVIPSPVP